MSADLVLTGRYRNEPMSLKGQHDPFAVTCAISTVKP
jgi:hypothetical protein